MIVPHIVKVKEHFHVVVVHNLLQNKFNHRDTHALNCELQGIVPNKGACDEFLRELSLIKVSNEPIVSALFKHCHQVALKMQNSIRDENLNQISWMQPFDLLRHSLSLLWSMSFSNNCVSRELVKLLPVSQFMKIVNVSLSYCATDCFGQNVQFEMRGCTFFDPHARDCSVAQHLYAKLVQFVVLSRSPSEWFE